MTKSMQMSIKMEPELHDEFMRVVATTHTPAAQVVRQLMRQFITLHETPNAITIAAMNEADNGKGRRFASADELFKNLGI